MNKWVGDYMTHYKQDMTEEICKGLIGKDIRCIGTVPAGIDKRREIGFEATIVGYEKSVLISPDGVETFKWVFLTDEGLGCPIWRDATWEVLPTTTNPQVRMNCQGCVCKDCSKQKDCPLLQNVDVNDSCEWCKGRANTGCPEINMYIYE